MVDWVKDLVEELDKLGSDCAHKEAAFKALDDSKKSVLAKIKLTFVGKIKSDAGQETEARASQEFKEHLKLMCDAREAAYLARVKYDTQDMFCRLRQTQASMKKAELNSQMAHGA